MGTRRVPLSAMCHATQRYSCAYIASRTLLYGALYCPVDSSPMYCPCRTCESMSAEALVVPSRAVLQADAFKKQSRTSERWLRILEVGLPDLTAYLTEQRAAGYTIIGKTIRLFTWLATDRELVVVLLTGVMSTA